MKKSGIKKLKRAGAPDGTVQKTSVLHRVFRLAFLAFALYCLISIICVQVDIAKKQETLASLQKQQEEYEHQNAEYERILSAEDEKKYMEQLAIEKLGYAYPNEVRYYDVSRN